MLLALALKTAFFHALMMLIPQTASILKMLEYPAILNVSINLAYMIFYEHCLPFYHEVVCANGALRLAGGSVVGEGRVEICINETWGTICDDFWETNDASVACRALGYSRYSEFSLSSSKLSY